MSAYHMWTLTCDDCGEIFDSGQGGKLADERQRAQNAGWMIGRAARSIDLCPADKRRRIGSVE